MLFLLGAVLAVRMPFERLPMLSGATLRVHAELPGLDAALMETRVTLPLEETFASVPRLHETVSHSRDGRATIELRFSSAAAREAAFDEVRRRLARAISILPAGMEPVAVGRDDPPPRPAVVFAIVADPRSAEAIKWAEQALARPLRELSEVASVTLDGAEASEVLIQPDSRRLATLGFSFEDLIQALRRGDEAPPRRGAQRGTAVMPASAEAIAARAVRLPDGESLALAEVAQVSVVSRPTVERPRDRGATVLTLSVYPRFGVDVAAVAERARAHLAWLRVNGLVQEGIEIHSKFDESHETRAWFKEILRYAGLYIAGTLLTVYLFFGWRTSLATFCAFGVWIPASAALLWGTGLTLNAATIVGLMLGGVALTALLVTSLSPRIAAGLATAALALPWVAGETLRLYAQTAVVFSLSTLVGVLVTWLMAPWRHADDGGVAPLTRLLPPPLRIWPRPFAAWIVTALVLGAALAGLHPMVGGVGAVGGTLLLRVQGEDPQRLGAFADELRSRFSAMPDLKDVASSTVAEERWRLQLDAQRMEELGLGLAEIGRAFAIAGEGLVVGEVTDADARLPLRLRLAAGAAGDTFERLLLRGERKNQAAVYLRNVGFAERVADARERLRVQRLPAVEIQARWDTALPPLELTQLRENLSAPPGCVLYWKVVATALEGRGVAP